MCGYSHSMGVGSYGYNNIVCSYGAAGCVVDGLVSSGLSCIPHLVSLHLLLQVLLWLPSFREWLQQLKVMYPDYVTQEFSSTDAWPKRVLYYNSWKIKQTITKTTAVMRQRCMGYQTLNDWLASKQYKELTVNFWALTEGLEFIFHVPNGITPQDSHNKELVR